MKKLIILLLLIFLISCSKPQKEIEPESNLIPEVQELPEIKFIPNVTTRQHGFEVNFTGPELRALNNEPTLFFNFISKDLLNRTEIRDPTEWNLFIYYLANDIRKVPSCFIEKLEENLWANTFCIGQKEIPEAFLNKELFFIYTNQTSHNFNEKTIRKIRNVNYALVSNFTLNK